MNYQRITYGEEIQIARRRAHLGQAQIAEATGIHRNTLVDIERNRLQVSKAQYDDLMAAIARLSATIEVASSSRGR